MNSRAGEYKFNLIGDMRCKSYLPKPLPPNPPIDIDEDTIILLSKANRSL